MRRYGDKLRTEQPAFSATSLFKSNDLQHIRTNNDCFLKSDWFLKKEKPKIKQVAKWRCSFKETWQEYFSNCWIISTTVTKCNLKKHFILALGTHLKLSFFNQKRLIYSKQRNFCLWLLRKEKNEYFANVNEKDINDNRVKLSNLSSEIKPRENKILENKFVFAFT